MKSFKLPSISKSIRALTRQGPTGRFEHCRQMQRPSAWMKGGKASMKWGNLYCTALLVLIFFCYAPIASGKVGTESGAAQGAVAQSGQIGSDRNEPVRYASIAGAPKGDRTGVLSFVRDKRIEIRSDTATAEMVRSGRKVVFDGNVRVSQGDLTLTCDRLVGIWKEKSKSARKRTRKPTTRIPVGDLQDLKSLTCTGNVKLVQGDRMAIAGMAVYDHEKRTIILEKGDKNGATPQLWQGPDSILADVIVIYIESNRIEMRSGQGNKIRTIIVPAKKKEKD